MLQKNPLFIIDVFNEIQRIDSKAHLVLIGFGGLEKTMMDRVFAYGISDKVENLGRREDIKQFYNAFDGFCGFFPFEKAVLTSGDSGKHRYTQ